MGDVASEKYEAAKDSVALFLDAQRHPFAQDLLVSEEPTPRPSFRPQSRPTSSNDAFEGQVDFVARQIDRYFGIFATRVSDVIPMSADYASCRIWGGTWRCAWPTRRIRCRMRPCLNY